MSFMCFDQDDIAFHAFHWCFIHVCGKWCGWLMAITSGHLPQVRMLLVWTPHTHSSVVWFFMPARWANASYHPVISRVITKFLVFFFFFFGPQNSIYGGGPPCRGACISFHPRGRFHLSHLFRAMVFESAWSTTQSRCASPRCGNPSVFCWAGRSAAKMMHFIYNITVLFQLTWQGKNPNHYLRIEYDDWCVVVCTYPIELTFLKLRTVSHSWFSWQGEDYISKFIVYIYIYLEPKWPLFWLERALFWRVNLQK